MVRCVLPQSVYGRDHLVRAAVRQILREGLFIATLFVRAAGQRPGALGFRSRKRPIGAIGLTRQRIGRHHPIVVNRRRQQTRDPRGDDMPHFVFADRPRLRSAQTIRFAHAVFEVIGGFQATRIDLGFQRRRRDFHSRDGLTHDRRRFRSQRRNTRKDQRPNHRSDNRQHQSTSVHRTIPSETEGTTLDYKTKRRGAQPQPSHARETQTSPPRTHPLRGTQRDGANAPDEELRRLDP